MNTARHTFQLQVICVRWTEGLKRIPVYRIDGREVLCQTLPHYHLVRGAYLEEKEISQAVISRLPRYYRYLKELKDSGKERISSQELSRIMKVTASQIRQDFNNFGGFGQQGYGYNTNYLYEEIGKILGLDHTHNMVLVGAGNLGQALVRYLKFKQSGFNFICAFDINPALFGQTVGGIPIRPLSDLQEYVDANDVDIVVLTIPKTEAREVAHSLTKTNIKAIWNFAHIDLELPPSIQVESVHLQDSLMKLSYNIHRNSIAADKE